MAMDAATDAKSYLMAGDSRMTITTGSPAPRGMVKGDSISVSAATTPRKNAKNRTVNGAGEIIRLDEGGEVTSIAAELRYPIGIAFDAEDRLFVTDQQGVQNTFNELNYIVPGARYGVTGRHDPERSDPEMPAAVQIPHPWTRSVNGLFFLPIDGAWSGHPFAGHGVGCEYNTNFLVRTSVHEVDGQLQGACYEFSHMTWNDLSTGMLGPICGMATIDGSIYVGTIQDSGWLGGLNQGQVIRFRPAEAAMPNGIREDSGGP